MIIIIKLKCDIFPERKDLSYDVKLFGRRLDGFMKRLKTDEMLETSLFLNSGLHECYLHQSFYFVK